MVETVESETRKVGGFLRVFVCESVVKLRIGLGLGIGIETTS